MLWRTCVDIKVGECSNSVLCGGMKVASLAKLECQIDGPLPIDGDHWQCWL